MKLTTKQILKKLEKFTEPENYNHPEFELIKCNGHLAIATDGCRITSLKCSAPSGEYYPSGERSKDLDETQWAAWFDYLYPSNKPKSDAPIASDVDLQKLLHGCKIAKALGSNALSCATVKLNGIIKLAYSNCQLGEMEYDIAGHQFSGSALTFGINVKFLLQLCALFQSLKQPMCIKSVDSNPLGPVVFCSDEIKAVIMPMRIN